MNLRLKNCRVRGQVGNFYLQNYITGAEIELDELQAKILQRLDVTRRLSDIMSGQEIAVFADTLLEQGWLERGEPNVFPVFPIQPYLKEVHFDITSRCNLKCKHCYGGFDCAGQLETD